MTPGQPERPFRLIAVASAVPFTGRSRQVTAATKQYAANMSVTTRSGKRWHRLNCRREGADTSLAGQRMLARQSTRGAGESATVTVVADD